MNKKINITFIILFFLITSLGIYTMLREPKTISYIENRNLNTFEQLTINKFIKGEYQNNLENALSDQFIGSGTIKSLMNRYLNITTLDIIKNKLCPGKYIDLGYDCYIFDCDDYIVKKPIKLSNELNEEILSKIESFNQLNKYTDMYYYHIPTSEIYDFETNNHTIDIHKIFKDNLTNNYHLSSLEINNYEEYKKYFYKTDHHWNQTGSYKGYLDIIEMLNIKDNIIEPIEEITFDKIDFYGSNGRRIRIDDYKEKFKVYKYLLPEYEITINGKNEIYGNQEEYFNGEYNESYEYLNHYGMFYGGDYGEIIYKNNNNQDEENILIISNSFSNSINSLIASHFNKTYIIDLRHYENEIGRKFNIKEYIKENNIDKTLIIMNYYYLEDSINNMEVSDGI